MKKDSLGKQNWLLAIAVISLAVTPLIFIKGEYAGSDAQAEGAINELSPGYTPWFNPFFEPPSDEIESLLFSSQAALGTGVIGYVIGLYKGRSEKRKKDDRG
ncbi:MAG: energy-coupling factor ABC transporter substrate-binding protein [Tildeniella nuda ZEHNDER 1965/U140]|jgi:cobalt/nickel transport protein|nr:energy-coupling factor ABC transporter substrate-binding protein [Tildeniella nuda ZEHNDER 1965/U140]